MEVTMPSPTRATMVSSVAPPMSCWMLVRTVTRALTLSWMPSLATASMVWRADRGIGHVDYLGIDARSARLRARLGRRGRWRRPWTNPVESGRGGPRSWRGRRWGHSAGEIMRFEHVGGDFLQAGLGGGDLGINDLAGVDLPQAHTDQGEEADPRRREGLEPQGKELADDHHDREQDDGADGQNDPDERAAGVSLCQSMD